ncbi:GDSL-type esterase/lipase family protein [Bacillus mycoides]|uniref:GDSL-type esterase/lipase family protein n=1 Tax=Bacillus mycoides TaxID=1405 RepID=UPI002930EDEC|nr:GDSL-type esterase/lipase family protein [Bacillus mycoides]WOA56396.1 GDSL-type esterase/lipase family protein [Bacillus mycoides]
MNFKKIAIISITLNVVFLLLGGYFIYSKGGVSFITNKVSSFASNSNDKNEEFSPAHKVRASVFKNAKPADTENSVVFLGDSLTDNNEWGEAFPTVKTYNHGIGGDTTVGVLDRLDQVISLKPSKVFLMVGINDLSAKTPKEEVLKNYSNIIKKITSELPNTKIFIQSMLPIMDVPDLSNISNNDIDWMNNEFEKIATEKGYTFINLHPLFADKKGELKKNLNIDGLHLNGEGYKVWENEIKNLVIKN